MARVGTVTREQIQAEQIRQQQLVLESGLEHQRRLVSVAWPLLKAAAPLCGDAVAARSGIVVANRATLAADYWEAASVLGFTDTVQVTGVALGSAAERAGLRLGDRILAINGQSMSFGSGAPADFAKRLARTDARVAITTRHDSVIHTVYVPRDTVCDYDLVALPGDTLNAFADGRRVFVYARMLEFAASDDELATVVAHEIAHNAMHHIDAKKTNALVGALFGAVLDIAAARGGVNTRGEYTRQFAALGSMVFSQDFEREADYVGMYILAAAGRPLGASANLWRRMAQQNPSAITFGYTHPTTAERFVRLDQAQQEIEGKLATAQPLRLAMKDGSQSAALQVARAAPRETTVLATTQSSGEIRASRPSANPHPTPNPHSAESTALASGSKRPATPKQAPLSNPAPAPAPRLQLPESNDRVAVAIIGDAASDSARAAAVQVFEDGKIYLARHEWGQAGEYFQKAILLDGSVAAYHAALGSVHMIFERWAEAEAEYTAASLIDVTNNEYRQRLLEARQHKGSE